MKTKFCPNCGNEIPLNEDICRYCLKDTADTGFLSTNSGQYHYSLETLKPVKISKTNSPIKETKNIKKYSEGIPIRRILLLMIVTCGLYVIYWFYRSSKFTKEHGKDVNPLLRTILFFIPIVNLVAIYLLFHDIKNIVKTKDISFNVPINFVLFIFGHLLSLWSIINIQEAMNEYYRLNNPNLIERRKFTTSEKVVMAIFVLIYAIIILSILCLIFMFI
ncbi:hypothetical protein [Methanobrevibacter woesei]|uniref:hypothetical protein n=1 Tax=Methanobrevibacter woesei TaxID=190976 RepID=UPI00255BF1AA|nr:hypothetical protein [Methanobrevibacter woesei]